MNLQDRISYLRRPRDYWDNTPELHNIFAGKSGFDWFIRRAARRLIEAGAIVQLGNRKFVDSELFIPVALQVLSNEASNREGKQLVRGAA